MLFGKQPTPSWPALPLDPLLAGRLAGSADTVAGPTLERPTRGGEAGESALASGSQVTLMLAGDRT